MLPYICFSTFSQFLSVCNSHRSATNHRAGTHCFLFYFCMPMRSHAAATYIYVPTVTLLHRTYIRPHCHAAAPYIYKTALHANSKHFPLRHSHSYMTSQRYFQNASPSTVLTNCGADYCEHNKIK